MKGRINQYQMKRFILPIGLILLTLSAIGLAIIISRSSPRTTKSSVVSFQQSGPPGYTGFPIFHIISVERDTRVTVQTHLLPPNDNFVVTMGPMGTQGLGGIQVATIETGSGGSKKFIFDIPSVLSRSYKISIRMQSQTSGYYAYNWFYNDKTSTPESTPTPIATPTPIVLDIIEAEWPSALEIDHNDRVRISLKQGEKRVISEQRDKGERGGGSNSMILPVPPIGGTPAATMKDAFGKDYEVCASAIIGEQSFKITELTPGCRTLNQKTTNFEWEIVAQYDGNQKIISRMDLEYKPIEEGLPSFTGEIWSENLNITVTRPYIKIGTITIATIVTAFIGSLLSASFIYMLIKDRKEKKRETQNIRAHPFE